MLYSVTTSLQVTKNAVMGGAVTVEENDVGENLQVYDNNPLGGAASTFPFDTDLVAYWRFDVEDADPTADSSVNSNSGILGSDAGVNADDPAYECDAADIAPVFDNTCSLEFTIADLDLVTVAQDVSLEPAAFTLSAWVNTSLAARQRVITKVHTAAGRQSYSLNIDPSGKPELRMEQSGGGTDVAVSSVTVDDGTWHHIAGVFDPTDVGSELKIFVDGELKGTDDKDFTIPFYDTTAAGLLFIGGWTGFPLEFMDGLIDEARIYDVALTADDIAALASSGLIIVSGNDVGEDLQIIKNGDVEVGGNTGGLKLECKDNKSVDITAANPGFAIECVDTVP